MRTFRLAGKLLDNLPKIAAYLGSICLVAIAILVLTNTITRTLFAWSLEFAIEISGYCLLGIVFLGLAYALKQKIHIRIELVTRFLPEVWQVILMITSYVIGLIIVAFFFAGSLSFVVMTHKSGLSESSQIAIPYFLPAILMVVGLAMLFVEMIVEGYHSFLRLLIILNR